MKKIYTCFFKEILFEKETLKDVLFVSVNNESFLEIKNQEISINDYKQIAKMFKGRYDKKKKCTWYHITFNKWYLKHLEKHKQAEATYKTIQ